MAIKISPAKKQKLKSAFNPDLHPRYPAGHPQGGKFMPKGSADYNQAIAANSKPEWELISGKDFRKYFNQWDKWYQEVYNTASEYDNLDKEISDIEARIAKHKSAIKQVTDRLLNEKIQEIVQKKTAIAYRNLEIVRAALALENIRDRSSAEAKKLEDEIANHEAKIERDHEKLKTIEATPLNLRTPSITKNQLEIAALRSVVAKKKKILDDFKARQSENKVPVERLRDSSFLYELFARDMRGRSLIGVKNGDEMGAAVALVPKKDHIYIDYLMTNPRTLIDGKSKGAGTAAIKAVVRKSMDMGKGGTIKLYALPSAMPFYEKLGFTRDDPSYNNMTLSSQAAKKLLGD